tara:strand:+ start:258 stop:590 length:333 start_codon:yes stop_codon:yes gene_type:complete
MDLDEKKEFSKILIEEIKKTKITVMTYSELCKPISPDDAIGRVSRMDAINNKSVIESALREAENKLIQLNRMKNEMKKKDFGICLKCEENINSRRLMIRPNSQLCINCAK